MKLLARIARRRQLEELELFDTDRNPWPPDVATPQGPRRVRLKITNTGVSANGPDSNGVWKATAWAFVDDVDTEFNKNTDSSLINTTKTTNSDIVLAESGLYVVSSLMQLSFSHSLPYVWSINARCILEDPDNTSDYETVGGQSLWVGFPTDQRYPSYSDSGDLQGPVSPGGIFAVNRADYALRFEADAVSPGASPAPTSGAATLSLGPLYNPDDHVEGHVEIVKLA